jgi:hypothetical protein
LVILRDETFATSTRNHFRFESSGRGGPDTANAPIAIRLVTRIIMSRSPTGGSNDVRDTSFVDYKVAISLICDTRAKLERFVALFSGDSQAAIDAVNSEEQNPTACPLVRPRVARSILRSSRHRTGG